MIIATSNFNPTKLPGASPPDELMPLGQWSDIVFLTWSHLCQSDQQRQGLKYILRLKVISDNGDTVISTITGIPQRQYDHVFPGDDTRGMPDSDKEKLGDKKHITGARFWDSNNSDSFFIPGMEGILNMLFTFS